jgi:hypothetical protein
MAQISANLPTDMIVNYYFIWFLVKNKWPRVGGHSYIDSKDGMFLKSDLLLFDHFTEVH